MKLKSFSELRDVLIDRLDKLDVKHDITFVYPVLVSDLIAKNSEVEKLLRRFFAKSILKELFLSRARDLINDLIKQYNTIEKLSDSTVGRYMELLSNGKFISNDIGEGRAIAQQTYSFSFLGAYKISQEEKKGIEEKLKKLVDQIEQILQKDPYYKEYELEIGFYLYGDIIVPVIVGTKKFQASDTGITMFLLTAYIFNIPIDDITSIKKIREIIERGFIVEFIYRLNQGGNVEDLIKELRVKYLSDPNYSFIPKIKGSISSSKMESYLKTISSHIDTAIKNFELILSDFIHSGLNMDSSKKPPDESHVIEKFISVLYKSVLNKNSDMWRALEINKERILSDMFKAVNFNIVKYIGKQFLKSSITDKGLDYAEKYYIYLSVIFDTFSTLLDRMAGAVLLELSDENYVIDAVSKYVEIFIDEYLKKKLNDPKFTKKSYNDRLSSISVGGIDFHDIKSIFNFVISIFGLSLSSNFKTKVTKQLIEELSKTYMELISNQLSQIRIETGRELENKQISSIVKLIAADLMQHIENLFKEKAVKYVAHSSNVGAFTLPIRAFNEEEFKFIKNDLKNFFYEDKNLEKIIDYAIKIISANISPKVIEFISKSIKEKLLNKNLIKTLEYYIREQTIKKWQYEYQDLMKSGHVFPKMLVPSVNQREIEVFAKEVVRKILNVYAESVALLVSYIETIAIIFGYIRNILVIYSYKLTNNLDKLTEFYSELENIKKMFEKSKLNYALIISEKVIEYITGLVNPVIFKELTDCIEQREENPDNLSERCKELLDIYENPEDISELPPDKSPDISHKNMKYILAHLNKILKFCSIITYNPDNDTVLYKLPYMKKPLKTKLNTVKEFVEAPLFNLD